MNATLASKAYNKIGVESGALGADPHKLIAMLYQGALLAIASAKSGMMRKDIPAKGAAISKAITIIDEGLNASLDKKVGGELAENLSSLYTYMGSRLLSANLNNDMGALDEVARLLNDLKGAWESIRPGAAAAAAAAAQAAEVVAPPAKQSQVYAAPVAANQMQPKAAPMQPQAKPTPVAAVPPQTKAASAAPVAAPQPKPVAAMAAAPARVADAPPSLPPQQQRMANKVQSLYGRV
ncbi:MAG: flagellar export chaperone FliS [Gallionella sp.]|nr:flagellar export chaperone FliS [Gallionella sp.]